MITNIPIYNISSTQTTLSKSCSTVLVVKLLDYQDAQVLLLTNILKAVNLTLEEVEIVHFKDENMVLSTLTRRDTVSSLITFGITPQQIGFNIQYKPYTWSILEDCKLLVCDPLPKIENDKALKMALWTAIKTL